MNQSLIDTDILSEILKRINKKVIARATDYYDHFGRYTISVITVTEIVKGWHKLEREDRIQNFLQDIADMEVLILDQQGAELAGRIYADLERTGQRIGLADSTIAATAIQYNLTLITGNLAHYQRIQTLGYNLKLDNWRI